MKNDIHAEIIAVGTELLLGQISNTNAQWISKKLAEAGINVYYHSVVGDNLNRVEEVFRQAEMRSDVVLVTGGLGPTDDDLTREAFQKMTEIGMKEDKISMDRIEAFFKKANREMTGNNRKQSLVFEDADVYINQAGMAPGMRVFHNETHWFFMPGVPREMKAIMETDILPDLKSIFNLEETIHSRMLKFIGIGESRLETELKNLIQEQTNPTIAPLAAEGEVALRLTAKARSRKEAVKLMDEAEKKIFQLTGEFLYGYDKETINNKVIQLLTEKKMTIAAAESLTGGKFADSLVTVPGASKVLHGSMIAYSAETKANALHIDPALIAADGTVSEACAIEMARNVKKMMQADIGISFTGVAGPEEEEGKEVGTVYIALVSSDGTSEVTLCHFNGEREAIRESTVKKGLELLWQHIR